MACVDTIKPIDMEGLSGPGFPHAGGIAATHKDVAPHMWKPHGILDIFQELLEGGFSIALLSHG